MFEIPEHFLPDLLNHIEGKETSSAFKIYLDSFIGLEEFIKVNFQKMREQHAKMLVLREARSTVSSR